MYISINVFIIKYFFQLTIEHDPDTVSRSLSTYNSQIHSKLPLTTTSSDSNIPSNKNVVTTTECSTTGVTTNDSVQREHPSNFLQVPSASTAQPSNENNCKVTVAGQKLSPNNNNRGENKERLFKRRDEGYMSGSRSRQLRRKNNLENRQSLDKERSSSLSRLLDE